MEYKNLGYFPLITLQNENWKPQPMMLVKITMVQSTGTNNIGQD